MNSLFFKNSRGHLDIAPPFKACFLLFLVLSVYLPVLGNGFVWDDKVVFFNNPLFTSPGHWSAIWTGGSLPDYLPLFQSLLKAEWLAWGNNPLAFHAVDLALHTASSFLLWRLLQALNIPGAWWGAALFALHPIHVASVAWVAETKNTLAMPLILAASLVFFRNPGSPVNRGLSLALFSLSLLAKSSGVTVPLVWLLLMTSRDHFSRKSFRSNLCRIIPFLVVSMICGVVTLFLQNKFAIAGHFIEVNQLSLSSRLIRSLWATGFYLTKLFYPSSLSMLYANRGPTTHIIPWISIGLVLIGSILAILYCRISSMARGWILGFFSFLILLAPVAGIIPMYYLRLAPVADHWLYLPSIPILGVAGCILSRITDMRHGQIFALCLILGFGWRTVVRCFLLHDDESLWRSVLLTEPKSWYASMALSVPLAVSGRMLEADDLAQRSLFLGATEPEPVINLAKIKALEGLDGEAMELVRGGSLKFPQVADFPLIKGKLLARTGQLDKAKDSFEKAHLMAPENKEAVLCMAEALNLTGQPEEAAKTLRLYLQNHASDSTILSALEKAEQNHKNRTTY